MLLRQLSELQIPQSKIPKLNFPYCFSKQFKFRSISTDIVPKCNLFRSGMGSFSADDGVQGWVRFSSTVCFVIATAPIDPFGGEPTIERPKTKSLLSERT
jgi:hypothetical protein